MFEGVQFPKTMIIWMEAHPGTAGWAQAIIAGAAIGAVYYAATMPIRAETKRLDAERAAKAFGLKLLLGPEIMTLKGQIELAIETGSAVAPPVLVSATLMERADQMYLLGGTGHILVQALGIINGVATQTRRFIETCDVKQIPLHKRKEVGTGIWEDNVEAYKLSLVNLDKVIDNFIPK
jgi:hypothetical protein